MTKWINIESKVLTCLPANIKTDIANCGNPFDNNYLVFLQANNVLVLESSVQRSASIFQSLIVLLPASPGKGKKGPRPQLEEVGRQILQFFPVSWQSAHSIFCCCNIIEFDFLCRKTPI